MRIAVVGCGAVGSYYGARLARTGHEVHFLLRSDYEAVRRNGVQVQSPQGDFHVKPRCARTPEEIGPCDVVLIGLKTTANAEFGRLLPPLVGPATAVLTLQNGLGNEEQLAKFFPSEQIMGGLCFVCLNRTAPGVIRHMDHGLVVLGEFNRWPEPRTHEIAEHFRHAGVSCNVTDNLARSHWEKLCWNVPFNGLGVAGTAGFEIVSGRVPLGEQSSNRAPIEVYQGNTLTTQDLLGDTRWSALVRELMMEIIHSARALGFDVAESVADKQIERTRTMGPYKASTLIDFERNLPLELESMFLEPLRQANTAGASVPKLERLCQVLTQLDPGNPKPN
jgi:2-dehydropantoate 2-reductase